MKKRKVTAAVLAAAIVASSLYTSASTLGLGIDDSLLMRDIENVEITTNVGDTENIAVTEHDTEESIDPTLWPIEVEIETGVSIVTEVDTAVNSEELNMQVLGYNMLNSSAELRLYFWDYNGDLPTDKTIWKDVLTSPDVNVQVVTDTSFIPVSLTVGGDESQTYAHFLQDEDDGNIVNRYVSVELPAGSSAKFDVSVCADIPDDLLVVPVVSAISDDGTFGEAYFDPVRLYWTESETEETMTEAVIDTEEETDLIIETESEAVTEFMTEPETEWETETGMEAATVESETATETYESEQVTESESGIESETELESETGTESETESEFETESEMETLDVSDLNPDDFITARLVILTSMPDLIKEPDYVIANYGDIYLIQYETVEQAMQAYIYYKDHVEAVEPDTLIETASEQDNEMELSSDPVIPDADENLLIPEGVELENETETVVLNGTMPVEITDIEVTEEQNPIALLNEMNASVEVKGKSRVIALIDMGAQPSVNIIDSVSFADDKLYGGSHGDDMARAIVSQNPDAQILSIRAMEDNGYGTISSIVAAMEYAIEQDVDFINLSLYAKKTLVNTVLESKILEAVEKGIIVVGAAGNAGTDVSGFIPGAVEEAWVIGAAGEGGYRLSISNYGDTVDCFVKAKSTSEATALFTGYVSRYGLEALGEFELLSDGITPPVSEDELEDMDINVSLEDGMLDPVMENYVLDHADPAYTDTEKIELIGILPVKQTLADASMLSQESNLDTFNCTDEILAFMGQMDTITAVYNLSDKSDYYVAYADTMLNDADAEAADTAMTYNNDLGYNFYDYHYDYDTGMVYIPKRVYKMEDAHVTNAVQIQILQKVCLTEGTNLASTVTAVSSDSEESYAVTYTGDVHDYATNIKIEKDLDLSTMTVVVNGCPVPKDFYIYDPISGNFGVNLSTAALQNIAVRSKGCNYDQIAPAGKNYADMKSINNAAYPALIDLNAFTLDSIWRGTIEGKVHDADATGNSLGEPGYEVDGAQRQPGMTSVLQYVTGYIKDASDIKGNDSNGNMQLTPANEGMWTYDVSSIQLTKKNTPSDKKNPVAVKDPIRWKDLDYTSNGRLNVRTYCSHISDPDTNYGGTIENNPQGGIGKTQFDAIKAAYPEIFVETNELDDFKNDGKFHRVDFLMRPLKIQKNKDGSGWIVFGFVGQRRNNQNGAAVLKLTVKAGSHIRIKKVNGSGGWDNSLLGAQFTLYSSSGSALETITIRGSGYHEFAYNCEPGKTYKIKETKVPAGKQKAADITVTIGSGSSYKETYSYNVTNKNNEGYIQVVKHDKNTGTTTSSAGLSMNGAVYGIYSGNTLVQSVTIQNGVGLSGPLAVGTYTVKEITAPAGYTKDTKSYTAVVTAENTETVPCRVTSTDTPVPAKVKVVKKSTAPEDILGLSNYSVQGAQFTVYTDAACSSSNAVGILTTDENGNTQEMELPFGNMTFYVKETKAPAGHKLNSEVKSFSVKLPADSGKVKQVAIENDPEFVNPTAFVEKLSSKGTPVSGVIFKVHFYDSTWAEAGKLKKTWYLMSDQREGKVLVDTAHKVNGRPEYTSDPFYSWNNQIVVPKGFLTIQEVEAPADYIIDSTVHSWDTKLSNLTVKRHYNKPVPCEIKIKKYKSDGKTPLFGVTFELEFIKAKEETTSSASSDYKPLLQEGEKITATTNAAGEIIFTNLGQGQYRITEVETVSGQTLLEDPIDVTLPMEMTQEEADAYDNVDFSKGKFDEGYSNKWHFYSCLYEITNNVTFRIPTTGGCGVWKYGYIGAVVMATIGACMIIYDCRKRRKIETNGNKSDSI